MITRSAAARGGNTGSNPIGDANLINDLVTRLAVRVPIVSRLTFPLPAVVSVMVRQCTALADVRGGRYPASMSTIMSPRAKAIAEGLVRSGRAAKFRVAGGFVRADGGSAVYWITADGTRALRGDAVDSADELQPGFLQAMVRAGSEA